MPKLVAGNLGHRTLRQPDSTFAGNTEAPGQVRATTDNATPEQTGDSFSEIPNRAASNLPKTAPTMGEVPVNNPINARVENQIGTNNAYTSPKTGDAIADAKAIEESLGVANAWSVLRKYTTPKDLADVKNMCKQINGQQWQEIYVNFFETVIRTNETKPVELKARDANLSEDWFKEPFYYTYVQYFGTPDGDSSAGFAQLEKMLDYLEEAGISNLFVLPHYESPMGDGGYDISDFTPRGDLGGQEAYDRFMKTANERGFNVATDLPFNHTSIKHKWFEQARAGDEDMLNYYLLRDGREKIGQEDRNGDLVAIYKDPDGTITERILIFPDVDQEHGEKIEINGVERNIYQEFYPFQLDLNLENPALLQELFDLLGSEANQGILGKRTDAIAHWIKKPGTTADGLPETHAVHAMIKSFERHVSPKAIILPEAVRGAGECASYCGVETKITGKKASSEGDALFNFEMQGALREMSYLRTTKPFWSKVFDVPKLPGNASWLNLLEHHDETYMGFISPENRDQVRNLIQQTGGKVYKNGMSAGGRFFDVLGGDQGRMANAVFSLYMTPGVPVMYYGTEMGAQNQPDHAKEMQGKQHGIFQELDVDVAHENCFDPRELQRGAIPAEDFAKAASGDNEVFDTFKRLNKLRAQRPSLQGEKITPLPTGHDDVLALIRFVDDDSDRPICALANLADSWRTLSIPLDKLKGRMQLARGKGFQLQNLLDDNKSPIDVTIKGKNAVIHMSPNSRLLLDGVEA